MRIFNRGLKENAHFQVKGETIVYSTSKEELILDLYDQKTIHLHAATYTNGKYPEVDILLPKDEFIKSLEKWIIF